MKSQKRWRPNENKNKNIKCKNSSWCLTKSRWALNCQYMVVC